MKRRSDIYIRTNQLGCIKTLLVVYRFLDSPRQRDLSDHVIKVRVKDIMDY